LTRHLSSYKHIVWDWNGTLLDDVAIAMDVMNKLLIRRTLPLLDQERYKEVFTFPVKEYYAQLGFNFNTEPFELLSSEFITEFRAALIKFRLHIGAEEVLKHIAGLGIDQSILSASEEQELFDAVNMLNINQYFSKIVGLNNHFAVSKTDMGRVLIGDLGLKPKEVLFIGDTIHDYEVADALGCDCLLISNGHQSYRKLSECGTPIIETIQNLKGL
jgi:phosphoglycolate phosphatase